MNKRILFLGGTDLQISAILKARAMGHYVITCDYLPGNPGHKYSNEYHNVSTTDKEGVLNLAKSLNVDGILAYASDPAAPTASYVAEKLGLPTNPFQVVERMCRKDLFRDFMKENGFLMPKAATVKIYEEAESFLNQLSTSVIIKPVDSSGSKGIHKVDLGEDFNEKFSNALSFSRLGSVIIEEFIHKNGFQIGGDGFLVNGELVFRCFGDIHFSKSNPLLPCSVSIPTLHNEETVKRVHREVQRLLSAIGMKMGALNFDILIGEENQVYILEIGPRNGGNMIPELTEYCTGVDMKEYTIKMTLGEDCSDLKMTHEKKYFSHYVIHTSKSGIVKSISKTEKLKRHILYEHYNFKIGDKVDHYSNSTNRLGIMLLKYDHVEEMHELIYNMDKYLTIEII